MALWRFTHWLTPLARQSTSVRYQNPFFIPIYVHYSKPSLENRYIVPVNLKVIAFDGELIGLTVEMYDTVSNSSSSNFLVFLNDYRLFDLDSIFKKKKGVVQQKSYYLNNFGILGMLKKEGFDLFLGMAKSLISTTDTFGRNSLVFNSQFSKGKRGKRLKENGIFGTNILGKLVVKKNKISKSYKSVFDCLESVWQPCDLNLHEN